MIGSTTPFNLQCQSDLQSRRGSSLADSNHWVFTQRIIHVLVLALWIM